MDVQKKQYLEIKHVYYRKIFKATCEESHAEPHTQTLKFTFFGRMG